VTNMNRPSTRMPKSRQRTVSGEIALSKRDLPNLKNDLLNEYHHKAWEFYESLPFPTRLDEAWRRTDLSNLDIQKIIPHNVEKRSTQLFSASRLSSLTKNYSGQILLGEKHVRTFLSENARDQGVIFSDLLSAEHQHADLLAGMIGKIVKPQEGKFAALASAFAQDGVLLYVPEGVVLEHPFRIIFSGAQAFSGRMTHLVVWLEEGASISLITDYESPSLPSNLQAFNAGVAEFNISQNADLTLTDTQAWGEHVWSFTHHRARVFKNGKITWITGNLGCQKFKAFLDVDLIEPGAEAKMNGFYISDRQQHFDIDTQQNHLAPHTISDLLYKGVLLGQSKAIWQGMIYVAPHALKIDGFQTNNNLILSSDAKANSIPGLEILADDVSCSHGATVSNIDDTEMFYLQSRGIPRKEASALITKGFLHSVFSMIKNKDLITGMKQSIEKKIV